MKIFEQRVVPESQVLVCTGVTCDLCGCVSRGRDWAKHLYEVAETAVTCKAGKAWPDEGGHVEYEIDICPKCFVDKLVPWLVSQGSKVERKELDW